MRPAPLTRRRFRSLLEHVALCGWIFALIVGAQGWVPVGAEWHAGAGRSLWSPCGSAMCACPPGAKTAVQRAAAARSCCDDEPDSTPAHAEQAPAGLPLFVALGAERRDDNRNSSLPEGLVLGMPSAPCAQIDALFPTGVHAAAQSLLVALHALDVPPPPPRA